MKLIEWNEAYTIYKNYIDLVIDLANRDFNYIGIRQNIFQSRYDFYKECLNKVFDNIITTLRYCILPSLHNLIASNGEKRKWKKFEDNTNSFIGMWEFFEYKFPVFIDDYGQQYYIKCKDEEGKLIDICGGAYNTGSEDIAYQVLPYIKKYILKDIKDKINKKYKKDGIEII